ncbi:MAG: hypothetical protein JO001_01705 [Alphaproteobacteria bacterium]|nr:hypothetical protein [Alphaproteobacteria bacterium]
MVPARLRRCVQLAVLLTFAGVHARADGLSALWKRVTWGAPSSTLAPHFPNALGLATPIDFGDSYTNVVLRDVRVGGVPLVVFFQMDKATGGLKRIQLERQRHGVNPPAFRAVLEGLAGELGVPDVLCGVAPVPDSGYQAAAERVWRRDDVVIRAIFRDTTVEAYEGCLAGDPSLGACGLTGQLLVRISPPSGDAGACPAPPLR